MNRSKLHLLWNMAATLLFCMGFASCSQDDMPGRGEQLPDGKYPLELMASSIDETLSRAAGKDEWTCDGTEYIGVRIGADGNAGKYVIGTDNSVGPASIDQTIYWQNTAPATVTAWYPFEAQAAKNITDQSTGYEAIDFLKATAENKIFTDKVHLNFMHQMAKVKCVFGKGAGITDDEFNDARVTFYGYTSASFKNGELTGTDNGWITPTADCDALLVPQDMTGKPLIKVSISGNDFIYAPDTEAAGNLQAGYQSSYTITVKADGIEVATATGGSWTDGGSEDVGITITYDGTETEAKTGDYYYADGTWSDGGLRKLYADGTMEWAETTPQPMNDKTCIGIVFYTGRHETDQSDYLKPLTENGPAIPNGEVHGYVVALTDVNNDKDDRLYWEYGPNDEYNKAVGTSTSTDDWSGYFNSQKIHEFVNNNTDWEMKHFPAALACETYGNRTNDKDGNTTDAYNWQKPLAAPSNTSGWFLPSCGQLKYLYQNNTVLSARMDVVKNSTPAECNYRNEIKWFNTLYYWSSTEYSDKPIHARNVIFRTGGMSYGYKYYAYDVRAILAF